MKLNNDRLKAFFQVAVDKNFHKAAEQLCLTQSALSQRVLKLEQELKVTLLIRTHEGVRLTEAGEILFEYANNLIAMEDEMLGKIGGFDERKGSNTIRIGAYSSVLRSAIIPALKDIISSSITTHVEFFSRELRELPLMLKSREVDFIVLDYILDADHLSREQIGVEHLVHVKPKGKLEKQLIFLDHDPEDRTSYSFFQRQNINNIVNERRFYDDIYGIIDSVKLGLGQAIVSEHLISHIKEIEIVTYRKNISNPVYLYFHKNRYSTKFHEQIIQLLKNETDKYLSPSSI